ncbi:MAG: flagellar protein FliS, partial [Methanomicrobia archaeon]|nr:flagellar protein FliS [Methanomicrobia archaeon]
ERAKERIEGQIERIGSYISKIKERTENEDVIALLNDAESHLDAARTYLENGEIRKAESEIQKAINILRNLKEAWENGYQEKIKQRLEKLNETAKRRIQFYEQALDTLRDEGYDVQDLERDLEKIKNDLGDITSLINEGKYKEALPEIRELCREMQEFQENLRRIRNES